MLTTLPATQPTVRLKELRPGDRVMRLSGRFQCPMDEAKLIQKLHESNAGVEWLACNDEEPLCFEIFILPGSLVRERGQPFWSAVVE